MRELDDDVLLLEVVGTERLDDGTTRPIEVPVTVGAIRAYRDAPNPCQCGFCSEYMPNAVRLLDLQEALIAGRISERELKRRLKVEFGYVRAEPITRQ